MKPDIESPNIQPYVTGYPYRPYVFHAMEAFGGSQPVFQYTDEGGIQISPEAMQGRQIDPWRLNTLNNIVVPPFNIGTNGTNMLVETMFGLQERFAIETNLRREYERELDDFTNAFEGGRFELYSGAYIAVYPERVAGKGPEIEWFPTQQWYTRALEISADSLYHDPTDTLSPIEVRKNLRNQVIAISGLSVGSNIAMVGAMDTVANHYKVADLKTAHTAYLNRARGGRQSMGWLKHYLVANELYDRNPFCNVSVYDGGISNINMEDFVCGNSNLDEPQSTILFLEEDDIRRKIELLMMAQNNRVDAIIGSDVDPYAQVDVRRFSSPYSDELVLGYTADEVLREFEAFESNPTPQNKRRLMNVLLGKNAFVKSDRSRSSEHDGRLVNVVETEFSKLVFGQKERLSGGFPQVGSVAAMCSGISVRAFTNIVRGIPVYERTGVNAENPSESFVSGRLV